MAEFDFTNVEASEMVERRAAIAAELDQPEADLDSLEAEVRAINSELEARKNAEAKKAEIRDAVAAGDGVVVENFIEEAIKPEERKIMDRTSVEYRDAFMAMLTGKETVEQRSILADNSAYGDGVSLPIGLDERVWNQVATAHPIVADVARLNTGIAIKVTKMTPAAISKKKDSDASSEETYTSAEVTLVGADYHSYINLSYAEAKMSQGAMETYLVNDIATVIGEAVATDIFARILSDAGTAQKVTSTGDMFADIKTALGLAKTAGTPVIYAPSTSYYEIVGAIKSGSPFNIGAVLGCQVKLDNAATKVTVVDPSMFVLNVVSDVAVKTQDDVKNAAYVIGGYMRCEGCLRKTTAAAYIG